MCWSPTASICPPASSATACSRVYGIETSYYDPLIGGDIAALMSPHTRAVFVEAPGSLSFEIQDIPAIAAAAHAQARLVLMDNTWASPLYFRALEKGVDLSIQSGTKYIGGHSDVMLGTVSANAGDLAARARDRRMRWDCASGPDDMYLGLRGLRTMGVRLGAALRFGMQGGALACGAAARSPACCTRRSKAIPATPSGSATFPAPAACSASCSGRLREAAVHAFLNELTLFGMGASWGGFESLAIPFDCACMRTATQWAPGGPTVRLHIGLEESTI